jgi:hypothetical protein
MAPVYFNGVDVTKAYLNGRPVFLNLPTPAVPWTPANITTTLWLDAADSSTVILNGSNVSRWDDKSGNGRNVSQNDANRQPTYNVNSLNGLAGINWGSTNNTRGLSTTSSLVAAQVFAVADYDGTDPFQEFASLFAGDPSFYRPIFTANNGTNWLFNVPNHLNGAASSSETALPTISSPFIVRNATNNTSSANRTVTYIGADTAFTSNRGWRGKIYEVIVIDSFLSSANTQLIEGYLAHKWGLTANLPANHPYKTNPPTV